MDVRGFGLSGSLLNHALLGVLHADGSECAYYFAERMCVSSVCQVVGRKVESRGQMGEVWMGLG